MNAPEDRLHDGFSTENRHSSARIERPFRATFCREHMQQCACTESGLRASVAFRVEQLIDLFERALRAVWKRDRESIAKKAEDGRRPCRRPQHQSRIGPERPKKLAADLIIIGNIIDNEDRGLIEPDRDCTCRADGKGGNDSGDCDCPSRNAHEDRGQSRDHDHSEGARNGAVAQEDRHGHRHITVRYRCRSVLLIAYEH